MLGFIIAATALASFVGPDVQGSPASWFSPNDYPRESLRNKEQGDVGFIVTISSSGKPQDCQITSSSGFQALDRVTCAAILVRGRFKPAKDALGNPLFSTYQNHTKWSLPDGHSSPPMVAGDIVLSVRALPPELGKRPVVPVNALVGSDGVATGCYVKPLKTVAGLEKAACNATLTQWHFTPMTGDTGEKVISVQSVLVAFELSQ